MSAPATTSHQRGHFEPRIERIVRTWANRAQVRSYDQLHDLSFDSERDDFLADLLPFSNVPEFIALAPPARSRVLSLGWSLYNRKTIQIENEIIVPACAFLIDDRAGALDPTMAEAVAQTMTDESFHSYMSLLNVALVADKRGLPRFNTSFELMQLVRGRDAGTPVRLLAAATVSEMFISDYLRRMSEAGDVQPIHVFSVNAHRLDEAVHATIFSELLKTIVGTLTQDERASFGVALSEAALKFASNEITAWQHCLLQQPDPSLRALAAALDEVPRNSLHRHDFEKISILARQHGMLEFSCTYDAYSAMEDGLTLQSVQAPAQRTATP